MKKKLTVKEYVYVASMLFGLFFGAGNLIFPTAVGQLAGRNMWSAILGLLITGVGLPLLGVAALGLSRSDGLFSLSSKVNRPYAYFFTCALYLTIGPFFAIPRCATVSFTVGLEQILPQNGNMKLYLLLFTLAFFIAALLFSLRPGKILTWVGKILNPFFLLFLGILVVVTLLSPAAVSVASVEPMGSYIEQPFFTGLKTAVGLITSCAETFSGLFPKGPAYRVWAVIFTLISLIIANFGLSAIIEYSVPVLMFLYPLSITLILLALFGRFFEHDRAVYNWVIGLTLVASLYDLLRTLPAALRASCHLDGIIDAIGSVLPLSGLGLGWVCPAALGLLIGLAVHYAGRNKKKVTA